MTQQRKFSSPSSAAFHSPDQANDTCHMSSKNVYAFAKPRIPTKTMTQQRKFSSPASAAFHSPDQANDTCHMSSKHVYAFAKPSCNMKMFLNQADMQECLTGYPPAKLKMHMRLNGSTANAKNRHVRSMTIQYQCFQKTQLLSHKSATSAASLLATSISQYIL